MQTALPVEQAEQLAQIRYLEALGLPKLEKSVYRLINKYASLMTEYHVTEAKLLPLIERSSQEGLNVIILREYLEYLVLVWKG